MPHAQINLLTIFSTVSGLRGAKHILTVPFSLYSFPVFFIFFSCMAKYTG
ncbi:hypothetical protein KFK09_025154 [Dendrobium nobile]|uniref:Uncharacterized protein n=1 Tax=Dendrobium nobile TaxID=94219 RepID=A0A8T3AFB3_DENNO|nr:hypothetical protein KFK09_025154 [Dendrobium nobile]